MDQFPVLVPLKEVCTIDNKSLNVNQSKIYQYLEVPHISAHTGIISNVRKISGKCLGGSSFNKFESGDVLFTRINPSKNRIAIAPPIEGFGIVSKEVFRLKYKKNRYIREEYFYSICSILQSN